MRGREEALRSAHRAVVVERVLQCSAETIPERQHELTPSQAVGLTGALSVNACLELRLTYSNSVALGGMNRPSSSPR